MKTTNATQFTFMNNEDISQLTIGKRVRTQVELDKDMLDSFHKHFGDPITVAGHQLVTKFVNDLISTRMKDVTMEYNPVTNSTQFKLDLFVFNRTELEGFIRAIREENK